MATHSSYMHVHTCYCCLWLYVCCACTCMYVRYVCTCGFTGPGRRQPPAYSVAAQMARLHRLGRAHSHEGVTQGYHYHTDPDTDHGMSLHICLPYLCLTVLPLYYTYSAYTSSPFHHSAQCKYKYNVHVCMYILHRCCWRSIQTDIGHTYNRLWQRGRITRIDYSHTLSHAPLIGTDFCFFTFTSTRKRRVHGFKSRSGQ